ncbi:hypothetical protein O3P69_020197 [Scylla paramamosain]|uniref:Uncharacterized protein n=1 Tax=Scylla paramamosain TaxID=85552 RepID=A0AAW0TLK3_SCYPA
MEDRTAGRFSLYRVGDKHLSRILEHAAALSYASVLRNFSLSGSCHTDGAIFGTMTTVPLTAQPRQCLWAARWSQ